MSDSSPRAVSVQRVFDAPRDLLWALLADTNRYDRALGMGLPRYTWRDVEGQRQLVGAAQQSGIHMEWVEDPYQWVEGRFLEGRRRFLAGPAVEGGLRVEVDDAPDGSRATVSAFGATRGVALKLLGPLVRVGLRRRLEAYLDSIAGVLGGAGAAGGEVEVPPVTRAARMLQRTDDVKATGAVTPVDEAALRRRAGRLASAPVEEAVREHIVRTLAQRPDEEVTQMRPFELAHAWGVDRREALRGFLHATEAGLVDLNWQINCPVCQVAAGASRTLADVENTIHCDACNIRYDVDFGANVEAVFRCNAALRAVEPMVYCAASPAFRPHVLAQLRAKPGATVTRKIDLADGRVHVRTLGRQAAGDLDTDAPPQRLHVRVGADRVELEASGAARDGPSELMIESDLGEDAYVLLERGGWSADVALGSVVASMPDFHDLFATEAPAAGLELSIGHLTLLFSDLTGSTALYERIGDARAYAVVQEHFRSMESVIASYGGAIVKTMGDAIMATFAVASDAVRAAIAMVEEGTKLCDANQIGVKLGVHEGPCLAVRANERLDFFGTTVNVAARLQGKAGTGQLVLSDALAREPDVAAVLASRPQRRFRGQLKGIAEEQDLVAVDLSARE